ncbi:MAG: hypothetical protein FJ086_18235 [Deltaproteobacteria bacterium]|nr:hypothetical protein [Deltaproteobacteria bacterium]
MQTLAPALLLLLSAPAWADIAPFPFAAGAGPKPLEGAAVPLEMAREEVSLVLHDGFAVVEATFWLRNPGEGTSVPVGFPGAGVRVSGAGNAVHRPLLGFRAWVGGAEVTTAPEVTSHVTVNGPEGRQYARRREETWHHFDVPCAPGETEVRVRYAVLSDPHRGDGWSSDERFVDASVRYVLATGAGWAGAISEAVIRVRAAPPIRLDRVRGRMEGAPPLPKRTSPRDAVSPALPLGMARAGKELRLVLSDLEPGPGDNLQFVYPEACPRPEDDRFPKERAKREARALRALGR